MSGYTLEPLTMKPVADYFGPPLDPRVKWVITPANFDTWIIAGPAWDAEYSDEAEKIFRAMSAAPELLIAAQCEDALEMPFDESCAVLERHGWDRSLRFETPASEFVASLRKAAIAKATGSAA